MVEVLLFDLGGVLVEYTGVQEVTRPLPAGTSEPEILERLSRCPHTEAFGRGQLSRQEFGERFVRDWGIDLPPETFLEEFRAWSKCLLPGAVELLATLRPRFRLAALSNSNELHWERNSRDLGVTDLFEVASRIPGSIGQRSSGSAYRLTASCSLTMCMKTSSLRRSWEFAPFRSTECRAFGSA
jgi:FMN phosphatase YigB (HAD superfamily)